MRVLGEVQCAYRGVTAAARGFLYTPGRLRTEDSELVHASRRVRAQASPPHGPRVVQRVHVRNVVGTVSL